MKRGMQGHYVTTSIVGEKVRAFVPNPLPPTPELVLSGKLGKIFAEAHLAIGRLDAVASILPETALFLHSYIRKEAVLSSQIEGNQSSLADLLLFESNETPGTPLDDVQEVSNCVAALQHGLRRLSEGFPISLGLLREMHEILLSKGRGSYRPTFAIRNGDLSQYTRSQNNFSNPSRTALGMPRAFKNHFEIKSLQNLIHSNSESRAKQPGEFRTSQNWIGGTRPGNARFVPPPPEELMRCLDRLEKFLHDQTKPTPTLLKAALAHIQFETIHPFLDGNGRLGRLLITLLLCADGTLKEPLLYLSLFFKQHRSLYYEHLNQVRMKGDWEAWLEFFFEGVITTATGACTMASQLSTLFKKDQERIKAIGRAAPSALKLHHFFQIHPVSSARKAQKSTRLSIPTLHAAAKQLVKLDILRKLPSHGKADLFSYHRAMTLLNG